MTEMNSLEPDGKCAPAACLLCGCERAAPCLTRPDNSRIVRCLRCGLLYVSPRPEPDKLDRHYRQSDPDYILNYQCQIAKRGRAILARAAKFLTPGRLLDVGCGYGFFMAMAENDGWHTQGVELSSAAAAHAREKLGLDVFTGSLAEAGLAGKTFDLISLQHTLEHVPDPAGMLKALRALLKEDGILAIAVPNASGLTARLAAAEWIGFAEKTHILHFTPRTLAKLLETAGFHPVGMETFQWDARELFWSAKIFLKRICRPTGRSGTKTAKPEPENAPGPEKSGRSGAAGGARRRTGLFNLAVAPLGWMAGKTGLGAEIMVLAKKDLHRRG